MYLSKQDNHDFPGFSGAFNFGPNLQSNKSVEELVNEITLSWPGKIIVAKENNANLHEANKLHLQNDKAYHVLGWEPRWPFDKTIFMTTQWYKQHFDAINSSSDEQLCLADLEDYLSL